MSADLKVIKVAKTKIQKKDDGLNHEASREEARVLIERMAQIISGGGESVTVSYTVGDRTTQYMIDCPQPQIARLLGAGGTTIMALRKVVAALLGVDGIRAIVEVPYYEIKAKGDSA